MAETRLHREQCGLIERCIRACTAAARREAILAPPMLSIRLGCHEPATRRIFMRSRRRDTRADTREPDLWGRLQSLARKLTTVGYDDPARVGQSVPASFGQIRALEASGWWNSLLGGLLVSHGDVFNWTSQVSSKLLEAPIICCSRSPSIVKTIERWDFSSYCVGGRLRSGAYSRE